jgi:ammonium transporter Rh
MPGLISGITSAIIASLANRDNFGGNRLYVFYPSRIPKNNSTEFNTFNLGNTEFNDGGLGRTASAQAGYQLAALGVTLAIAILGGILTGLIMRIPVIEQIEEVEEMFDDEPNWITPEDYSLKLTEVRVQQNEDGTPGKGEMSSHV